MDVGADVAPCAVHVNKVEHDLVLSIMTDVCDDGTASAMNINLLSVVVQDQQLCV